ncbi:MAG: hypothetical protein ORN49_06995, partial [Rhodobacteraceae bacterium]|nr:hypothetical protein [Paracoccaceae bacterium]
SVSRKAWARRPNTQAARSCADQAGAAAPAAPFLPELADARPKTAAPLMKTRPQFLRHAAGFILLALGFLTLSLGAGMIGYHLTAGLGWIDSLLNASMILTGMGPVDPMPGDEAKLFASAYALFSGAVYPAMTALILYPFLHRMLVILHLQGRKDKEDAP